MKGNVDTEWWSNILRITTSNSFGSGGPDVFYDGWFITKILNKKYGLESLNSIPTGLASVPLTINDNGVKSKSAIVLGIAGFKIDDSKPIPVVEAVHGWTILR